MIEFTDEELMMLTKITCDKINDIHEAIRMREGADYESALLNEYQSQFFTIRDKLLDMRNGGQLVFSNDELEDISNATSCSQSHFLEKSLNDECAAIRRIDFEIATRYGKIADKVDNHLRECLDV